ncbi:MAG: AMP-dependent synthetase/ligase [Methylocystaceae bacterium]
MFMLDRFEQEVHTIPQMMYLNQANFGGRPANIFYENNKWRLLTYYELVTGLENIALGLMDLGIQKGDRVAVKAHNSVRWAWADTGSLFAGAATVSIYPSLSKEETLQIYDNSQFRLIYLDNPAQMEETLKYADQMPAVQYFVCLQKGFKGDGKRTFGLGELIGRGASLRDSRINTLKARVNSITGDDPATMVYTSGTTGRLKGVMHTHKSMHYCPLRGFRHLTKYGRTSDSNIVSMVTLPLSHIMEKCNGYYGPMATGACIGFAQSPSTFLSDIQAVRPTWVTLVPRVAARALLGFQNAFSATEAGKNLWIKAMDVAQQATYAIEDKDGYMDLTIPYEDQLTGKLQEEWLNCYNTVYWRIHHALGGRLRDLNVGGAYLDPELQRKYVGMGVYIGYGYGLTESGAGVAESCPNAYKVGWISPPNPTSEFKIEDDGELLIRGPGIITNYYNNPQADAESFTEDGWFKTGDIAEADGHGYIRIVDRKKTIIVLDTGKNVAQARIEALCANSALIEQVVVVGNDRKYISALVVPNFDLILNVFKSQALPINEDELAYEEINGMRMCVKAGQDIVGHPALNKILSQEIEKVNAQLEDYETIKQFRIMPARWLETKGEVTPSQKIKTKVVLDRCKTYIDDMYK